MIRTYAGEWMEGASRFSALLLPHLLETVTDARVDALMDTRHAGRGSQPVGLDRLEDDELAPVLHPALDPRITGEEDAGAVDVVAEDALPTSTPGHGQTREPFEYGEILRVSSSKKKMP